MAEHSRYHVSDERASVNKGFLKNKLGIKNKKKLDDAETLLLADTYTHFFELLKEGKVEFDLSLLFSIHKYFFGTLYDWAGKIRTVDISKNDILFAPVKYIDKTLKAFKPLLKKKIPKQPDTKNKLSKKLAIIHNEFNIIHPFREGNGRTIRLFLDLISVSLGYDPIDWSKISNSYYINACVEGASDKHEKMTKIIKKGLKKQR
ncbi:MAG: Fic family protein [Patescibacteria group bacterium]